jgi:NAD-dependent SIR2 family protein deacetylase
MDSIETSLDAKIEIVKTALDKTEALIIGAGAGLSRARYAGEAAGLDYDNLDTFNTLFPGYHDRYGMKSINEADFYQFPTPEEQYAYWVRNIAAIRHDYPPGKPYLDLHRIIKDKNHVILTTNTDGQFFKSGFDPGKIRYNFEFLFKMRKYTGMIRINLNVLELSLIHEEDRAAIIQGDLGPILHKLAEEY